MIFVLVIFDLAIIAGCFLAAWNAAENRARKVIPQ